MLMHQCVCSSCEIDSLMDRRSVPSVEIWTVWGQTLLLRTLWTDTEFKRVMWKTQASGKLAANRTVLGWSARWLVWIRTVGQ